QPLCGGCRRREIPRRGGHFLDVATGAEAVAGAGKHDGAHVVVGGRPADGVVEQGIELNGNGVFRLRAVDGDGEHPVVEGLGNNTVCRCHRRFPGCGKGEWVSDWHGQYRTLPNSPPSGYQDEAPGFAFNRPKTYTFRRRPNAALEALSRAPTLPPEVTFSSPPDRQPDPTTQCTPTARPPPPGDTGGDRQTDT